MTPPNTSPALLKEILSLLQNLHSSVNQFQEELQLLRDDVNDAEVKVTDFIQTYMPDDVAEYHVIHHRKMQEMSFFQKFFAKILGIK